VRHSGRDGALCGIVVGVSGGSARTGGIRDRFRENVQIRDRFREFGWYFFTESVADYLSVLRAAGEAARTATERNQSSIQKQPGNPPVGFPGKT
jgi:hypothetical protein